ncbi:MAG: CBS domain-containing protein [Deltaproteobacteria bacterium]|nr:CBS domain-containing protein [Deltaproteobacteria bacterium]
MEVITSHTSADFDTYASMIAAKKLYPRARLVFSGSIEKGLRDAIENLIRLPYRFEKAKDIDLSKITKLIIVDIRCAARIGPFSEIIGKKGLDIHIYDHHPSTDADIRGSVEAIKPYGSTTTVLVHIIKEKGIRITPEEATVFMAGIYEDTGSLAFPSTTVRDYEAAAFLLSKGADLKEVSDLLRKELTPEEVSLLNDFLHSETTYDIGGADVVVAEGYIEKYVGDISILAHKIIDIEGMDCLFLLVDSEDRVHLVARSRTSAVDVGRVARALGGGGHAHAASATIKDLTLIQAKEKLLEALRKIVAPATTAADIMSFPAITIKPETLLKDAVELMRRYNINAVPVVTDGEVAGVITRQVVDKAVYHGLGPSPVSDCMTTEVEWVEHDTSIDIIREKVVGHGQRLLPVIKDGKVAGVITRTDLIKLLQEELVERPGGRAEKKTRSLAKLMRERLPEWAIEILKDAGRQADTLGFTAYAVGGFVRDLLLRRENLDMDIVIEGGDGIVFARSLAGRLGLKVKPHQRFKTAVLIYPDGVKVDVATARLEYYEKPGALPTVEQSSLKLDLYRRDFIINTLAVALNPKKFGELIDFFGAQRDIKEKTIRVLHNLSFVEDPTRMLRAVRFSEKFGFKISKHTLNLIKNSVKLDIFKRLSGARLIEELKNILEEETASKSIKRLHELGLLGLIHKGVSWDADRELFFERTRETLVWHKLLYTKDKTEDWLALFLALTDPLSEEELKGLTKTLMISGKKRVEVLSAREQGIRALNMINAGLVKKESALYALLEDLPIEILIYLMARTGKESARKAISNYITKLKYTETAVKGKDLLKMGIPEGPFMGEVLEALLKKRLDRELETREDEEAFVKNFVKTSKKKKKA